MTHPSRPWAADAGQAVVRLVCLPYAGGGSAVYYRWRSVLPAGVDLMPICLPGREGRAGEPIGPDLTALARDVAEEIAPRLDRPFVLLGHSMGAWLAFELARHLRRRAARLPELLVVAASKPPNAPRPAAPLHQLPDELFVDQLRQRFDGIPPAVRDNAELLELLLPVLRADVQLVETYRYDDQPPLDVEILALGGTDDPSVSAAELAGWARHTTRKFSARLVPGGHFFLFRGDGGQLPAASTTAASPALRMILHRIAALSGPNA